MTESPDEIAYLTRMLENYETNLLFIQERKSEFVLEEVTHEYLIEEIRRWFDAHEQEQRAIEDLVTREVETWQQYRTLIPEERLIAALRDRDADVR